MKHRRPHLPAPKPTESALVQIEKPIYGGAFLARLDGKATFVPLTLPGEQARIRMVEDKRSYATGEPEEIVSPSADRVQPRCPHFGVCGGCSYQHASYEAQLGFKQEILRETFERAGVPSPEHIEVLAGDPWAYRNRIRLAFDARGRVGYRARRSHEIIAIQGCPISAPLLVRAAPNISEILRDAQLPVTPGEISLFCDAEQTKLLASIFVHEQAVDWFDKLATALSESIPELAGLECVRQLLSDEAPKQLALRGAKSIVYEAAAFAYQVDHGGFFQVNRALLDTFVDAVVAGRHGTLAWDLFAGVGLFARQLTTQFDEVVAVESAPASRRALKLNLEGTQARFFIGDTLSFLKKEARSAAPDLIVVDPPRSGLGPEITSLLANVAAPSVVYVSCDPSTLARDLKSLLASGYAVASVALADLFPHTFHLETVVTLRKP